MGFRRTDEEGRPVRFRAWRRDRDRAAKAGALDTPAWGLWSRITDQAEARKGLQRKDRVGQRGVDRVPQRIRDVDDLGQPVEYLPPPPADLRPRAARRAEARRLGQGWPPRVVR